MQRSTLLLGVTLIALTTVATGVVTGTLGNRWQRPHDLGAAAKSLDLIAKTSEVGPWKLKDSSRLSPEIVKLLHTSGDVSCKYQNDQTGDIVELVVLVGETGPLSTHSPEVCYSSRDYQVVSEPTSQQVEARGVPANFLSMTLSSDGFDGSLLRVWYAWHNGQQWFAPRNARISLRAEPFLYKIQISTYLTGLEDERRPSTQKAATNTADEAVRQREVCRTFLMDFLPLLNRALGQHSTT
ncbi:MAG: EpsI family protein [Pirellulales bacterium]|nr:EpsI family protein [Pirellulales bacterium]